MKIRHIRWSWLNYIISVLKYLICAIVKVSYYNKVGACVSGEEVSVPLLMQSIECSAPCIVECMLPLSPSGKWLPHELVLHVFIFSGELECTVTVLLKYLSFDY